jgi:hypothetical protein
MAGLHINKRARRRSGGAVIALGLLTVFLGSCSLMPWQSDRYGGEASEVYFLDVGRDSERDISYKLRLGDVYADVYFAFVNYGPLSSPQPLVSEAVAEPAMTPSYAPTRTESSTVSDFNNRPPALEPGVSPRGVTAAGDVVPRAGESEGADRVFYQFNGDFSYSSAVEITATLQSRNTQQDGATVNIWVDDNWWSTFPEDSTDLVTQTKADALADAFLRPDDVAGVSNDIYDWVTDMLGEPWGEHGYANLLSPADYGKTIDILLVDVLQDGSTDGGIVGFFWGKDNYLATSSGLITDYSNERIMFYLDAPIYAQLQEGEWDVANSWPELGISTLAHEFQHMIHFYQKNILRRSGLGTETWLNEMLSLVTEDILADKLGIAGPRGVSEAAAPAGDAGESGNSAGWLPYFNVDNDISLYAWNDADPIPNYAVNYAFGAFLARNYGGPAFLHETVQSFPADESAIEQALDSLGYREDFREVLSRWAAAVLVSDEVIVPFEEDAGLPASYNAGTWFESSYMGTTYRLGSINLFNYLGQGLQEGPKIYYSSPVGNDSRRPSGSTVYYLAGEDLTGTVSWDITLGATTDMVVVVKVDR